MPGCTGCRVERLLQFYLVQFQYDGIRSDQKKRGIISAARRVVDYQEPLIDALGKRRSQNPAYTIVPEEVRFIRERAVQIVHICRDDSLVCAQRLFPARKHLHRQILQHILLMLHAVCAPFVGDDTDAKLPVRFYDGRSAGTVKFRCRLQHAVDDGV